MSKAFTRESDDLPERPEPPRLFLLLPAGAKNYLTPDGARRLREELDRLVELDRPRVAATRDEQDTPGKLREIDQRIQHLRHSLESAVVVPPPVAAEATVRFGATVTVRDRTGEESTYRIVGVDETNLDRGWVSWLSPIARALLNARYGEHIRLKLPAGEETLEITSVVYE